MDENLANPPPDDLSQPLQVLWSLKDWAGAIVGTGALTFLWHASGRVKTVEIAIDQHNHDIEDLHRRVEQNVTRADFMEVKQRVDRAADKADIEEIKTMIRDLTARINRRFDVFPGGGAV
jgi:hypothetical protein